MSRAVRFRVSQATPHGALHTPSFPGKARRYPRTCARARARAGWLGQERGPRSARGRARGVARDVVNRDGKKNDDDNGARRNRERTERFGARYRTD